MARRRGVSNVQPSLFESIRRANRATELTVRHFFDEN